jgi:hypothetical protein
MSGPLVLSEDLRTAYEQLADIAISANSIAEGLFDGTPVMAVPDVILLEYAAQGLSLPNAPRVRREDGREVAYYRLPKAVAG